MYICNICGHTQEELETKRVYDDNLLGGYMDETVIYCSCCSHGELVEATECPVCGELFDNTELHGVCECCLEKYETVGDALEYGEGCLDKVHINGFIAYALDEKKINEILTKYVEEHFTDHCKEVKDYCSDDKSAFCDFVIERENV